MDTDATFGVGVIVLVRCVRTAKGMYIDQIELLRTFFRYGDMKGHIIQEKPGVIMVRPTAIQGEGSEFVFMSKIEFKIYPELM